MKRLQVWFARGFLGLLALFVAWCVTGLAMAQGQWDTPPRGVLIEVDGRKQRLVCEGQAQAGQPLVVFESGIYSGAADWGYIQPQVAKKARTCAYDRAGLGWSQPAQGPRTPALMARELRQLLGAAGETGPYVLVGHSMAGLLTRAFIAQFPEDVTGLVLIDAVDPEAGSFDGAAKWIARFQRLAHLGARVAPLGLMKPLSPFYANKIGLDGAALKEKRRLFGAAHHVGAAAREIDAVAGDIEVARAGDAHLAKLPVSTISAGPIVAANKGWKDLQARAARLSPQGRAINVEAANHTSILGPRYGQAVIAEIDRVLSLAVGQAPQLVKAAQ
ncbi:MAG: hypothetical protein RL186_475 [Pseudomonadota bacterium]|jgi:pimeloyl-ACP methyl ester carboxylesterase